MKCEACEGKGFKELEHGLIMVGCEPCNGTGEIQEDEGATYTGLLFQLAGKRTDEYSDDELWAMAKEECLEKTKLPYSLTMPCGNIRLLESASDIIGLPIADILCPCGNPNHYIVRFIDDRSSGTGSANQPTGGEDTSKPKCTKKPKTKRKAKKRTR